MDKYLIGIFLLNIKPVIFFIVDFIKGAFDEQICSCSGQIMMMVRFGSLATVSFCFSPPVNSATLNTSLNLL